MQITILLWMCNHSSERPETLALSDCLEKSTKEEEA